MSRLIEEDVAVERISNAIWHLPNEVYPRFNNFDTVHAVVKDAVNAVPAIEPRAKGHWIVLPDVIGVAYCSECNYQLTENNTNFCPNCGADMREEEE